MDDVTLGKLLTEAHRGQADYCEPEGVSVSQSSSVVFDGAGKPAGERDVDQSIGFGVTRNTYSAHSKFSENTQAEKVVDRSGKPEERDSSNAQIRTLLDVRGVSWTEVATVPKRKSHRALDFNLSWNSEEDIWKGRKKSNGTKRKRRRVKRNNHNATHRCTCVDGMTRARRT